MNKKAEKISYAILGIVAIVAIAGLVIMFAGKGGENGDISVTGAVIDQGGSSGSGTTPSSTTGAGSSTPTPVQRPAIANGGEDL